MRRDFRAFSLLETMVALGLISVILFVLAGLTRDYARASNNMEKSQVQAICQGALKAVERDVLGASRLVVGSPSSFPTTAWAGLTLEQIRIGAAGRFPDPAYPAPDPWLGEQGSYLATVSFQLASEDLSRSETIGGTTQTEGLAKEIKGLSFQLESRRLLVCRITIQERRGLVPLQLSVFLPEGVQL